MNMRPKRMYLAQRHPSLTRAEFKTLWRQHAALAMSLPRWRNIVRYVHCDITRDVLPDVSSDYDGIGIIWYRSLDARAQHRNETTSRVTMESDEDRVFATRINNCAMISKEFVRRPGPAGAIKTVRFARRKEPMSPRSTLVELHPNIVSLLCIFLITRHSGGVSCDLCRTEAVYCGNRKGRHGCGGASETHSA